MCGRFAASASSDELVETFEIDLVVDEPVLSFNLAPTDPVPAVVARVDAEGAVVRKLVTPRWGLVPSWSKDASGAARLINARLESVSAKPAFRKAFASRRCLIPADGYYEWYPQLGADGKVTKQPWFIHDATGEPFVMAGLYEFWRDPRPESATGWLTTCTIITTQAVDAVGHLHERMPVSVPKPHWATWLDPHITDPHVALGLLAAPAPERLAAHEVSRLVNSVRNDGPELVAPLT